MNVPRLYLCAAIIVVAILGLIIVPKLLEPDDSPNAQLQQQEDAPAVETRRQHDEHEAASCLFVIDRGLVICEAQEARRYGIAATSGPSCSKNSVNSAHSAAFPRHHSTILSCPQPLCMMAQGLLAEATRARYTIQL